MVFLITKTLYSTIFIAPRREPTIPLHSSPPLSLSFVGLAAARLLVDAVGALPAYGIVDSQAFGQKSADC